jgi:hypothetical protein
MSSQMYHQRIACGIRYNPTCVANPARDYRLARFSQVVWAGQDHEGWCVLKKDPLTVEVVRIDFLPPA